MKNGLGKSGKEYTSNFVIGKTNSNGKMTIGSKSDRRKLEKKLDELASELCKFKANYRCEKCHRDYGIGSHHLYSRTHKGTRWLEENLYCLCRGHHLQAHTEHEQFRDFAVNKIGLKRFEILKMQACTVTRFSISDLQMIGKDLSKRLRNLKKGEI